MKRSCMFLVLALALLAGLFSPLPVSAQDEPACSPDEGTVISRTIDSAALGREKTYVVYLPPNWCELEDLPLLVMLHGLNGNQTDWTLLGGLNDTADELIASGEIEPLVILMPDGEKSFYLSGPAGDFETYILDELIGAVDDSFPTAATRERRFIGGLSMGGYGALYLGLTYPDRFSAIGAHSPAVFEHSARGAPIGVYGADWGRYEERAPAAIILREGWPADMRVFIDVGSQDFLLRGVYNLFGALVNQTNPIEEIQAHVWPGRHDWSYWRAHSADYLRFYAGT